MRFTYGIISVALGLFSFVTMAKLSWDAHRVFKLIMADGNGDISPTVVGGIAPFIFMALLILLALLGLFFGLFRFKGRGRPGRILSIIGICLSAGALLVIFVPFLLLS